MCVCLATGISVYFADLKSGEGAGKVAEMHGCTIQYARRAAITGTTEKKDDSQDSAFSTGLPKKKKTIIVVHCIFILSHLQFKKCIK